MSKRTAGFTLVEVLVATILLSVVMGAVYTLFHSVIRSWRTVEQDCDLYQDARGAVTLFEHEVGNILPAAAHLFEGDSKEVTMFIVSEPLDIEKTQGAHLMRVRYRLKKAKDQLIREEARVEASLPQAPPADQPIDRGKVKVRHEEEFVIASGVKDFDLTYIWIPQEERPDPKIPPEWVEPIESSKHKERWGLPQGIQIKLKLADPNDPDKTLELRQTIPLRMPSTMMKKEDLLKRLGDSS